MRPTFLFLLECCPIEENDPRDSPWKLLAGPEKRNDAQRRSDGPDPEHGKRAAVLAKKLRDGGLFEATDEQMVLLEHALEFHADGHVSEEPTCGVCWDADRLDLVRCRITPDPGLLSTDAARVLLASWTVAS